ncbi:MAG: L-aspartate oxidase [Cellulosilyticaceae bacterium]
MEKHYDVIIVGTGVAGLYCALHIPEQYQVLLITKKRAIDSNSYLAQGGIATLRGEEDYDTYVEDTLKAGHYENSLEAVKLMIEDSTRLMEELMALGVDFDKKGQKLSYTKEGAHRINRILHHKDITGQEIVTKLLQEVKKREHLTLQEHTQLLDILAGEQGCQGVVVSIQGHQEAIYAQKVILATGGVGGLFESSTNQTHLTGDSLAIALRHHIPLKDVHYIQIHPTTLYTREKGRRFLISEAVRGEGGILLNSKGKRFVDELLPRDKVAQAIQEQIEASHIPYVWLSLVHLEPTFIEQRFPNIYKRCKEEGYDLKKQPIPVTPAQHYFMGGIEVDTYGMTGMVNLFAIGETSCNGVHGANRLASNSLLESLVFAGRCATSIASTLATEEKTFENIPWTLYDEEKRACEDKQMILEEIKKRDEGFYDQWCKQQHACG